MKAHLSRKLLALFALVVSAAGTGCAAADTDQGAQDDDVPEMALGEMKTRIKGAITLGEGSAPNACPAGKEQFYDHCYKPCPADYPVAHITMCFQQCSPGYMISPGNCEVSGTWVPNPLGRGGSFTKTHYPVASVDRGAGTPLVCAEGMVESNGRCYGTPKPTPGGGGGSAGAKPSAPAGGNGGVDTKADACNHKAGHTWVQELRACLSKQEYNDYMLGQLGKKPTPPEEPVEPLPCEVTLSCPGKIFEPSSPGFEPMPKLGCMTPDDPFCFDPTPKLGCKDHEAFCDD